MTTTRMGHHQLRGVLKDTLGEARENQAHLEEDGHEFAAHFWYGVGLGLQMAIALAEGDTTDELWEVASQGADAAELNDGF